MSEAAFQLGAFANAQQVAKFALYIFWYIFTDSDL
jgi:hypothetical protein